MDINHYIVQDTTVLVDVMKRINDTSNLTLFVCQGKKLIGAVTDGDIRRHLIKNRNLNVEIKKVANLRPVYIKLSQRNLANQLMKQHDISIIPVVDDNMTIVDFINNEKKTNELYTKLKVPVVIMAGGKGTRLLPYTNILPKPLIPIGEKTITEHIMDHFLKYGCNDFNLIVNYKKDFIKSYFLEKKIFNNITYTEEATYLGTGGGLKLLKGKYSDTFFMTNCDILVETDYSKIFNYHKKSKNIITIVSANKKLILPYGIIKTECNNYVMDLEEKPEVNLLINTGFYIIEPNFLDLIPDNIFIHITDIIKNCIKEGKKVGSYIIEETSWMDMGQIQHLQEMKLKFES